MTNEPENRTPSSPRQPSFSTESIQEMSGYEFARTSAGTDDERSGAFNHSPDGTPRQANPLTWNEFFSWFVILAVIIGVNTLAYLDSQAREDEAPPEQVSLAEAAVQGKLFFISRKFAPQGSSIKDLDVLRNGSVQQRLAHAILLADATSPAEGIKCINDLNKHIKTKDYQPTKTQRRLLTIVENVMQAHQSSGETFVPDVIPAEDREYLADQMGWFGDLALAPRNVADPQDRERVINRSMTAAVGMSIVVLTVLGFIALGFVLAGIAIVFYSRGRLMRGTPDNSQSRAIYLETFALWMVLFFASQILVGIVVGSTYNVQSPEGDPARAQFVTLALMQVIFFGSLSVLFWPVIRGIDFATVRRDIGWYSQNSGWRECWKGFLGYGASVPLLGLGVLGTVIIAVILALISPADNGLSGVTEVVHPIQTFIASGDRFTIFLTIIAACVCAPVVEETMFRGVFYRYLRDRSATLPRFASVAFAALMNGLVFAVIHPQGLVGIPVLVSLAIALSLIRQWRGSLVAPIFVHAIHNGFALTVTLLMLSS